MTSYDYSNKLIKFILVEQKKVNFFNVASSRFKTNSATQND